MSKYVAKRLTTRMKNTKIKIQNSKVLGNGYTFKENCPDIRNSKVFDLIKELKKL